jgi:hypothetical protein
MGNKRSIAVSRIMMGISKTTLYAYLDEADRDVRRAA